MTLHELRQRQQEYNDNPEWARTLPPGYIAIIRERIVAEEAKLTEAIPPAIQKKVEEWIAEGSINTFGAFGTDGLDEA